MTQFDSSSPRLPDFSPNGLVTGPIGGHLMRVWFDRFLLWSITQWFFPLSKAWAVGLASEGDPALFRSQFPEAKVPRSYLGPALAAIERRKQAHDRAEAQWRETAFDPKASEARLVEAELRRQDAAHRMSLARGAFAAWHTASRLPAVQHRAPTPEMVERLQGARLADPNKAFGAGPVEIEESQAIRGPYGRVYWLRFPSSLGDTAWARVYEPEDVKDPPTLVFLHGISMEFETWREHPDFINALARQGIRVVRLIGPWHGRRRPPGVWGGEPAIAHSPLGLIELVQHWTAEIAAVTAWARNRGSRRVGVGGISLGSLTSQVALSVADQWPADCRPDTGFLIATSRDMVATGLEGRLAGNLGVPDAVLAAGWDHAALARWRPLMEPQHKPAVDPGRIVMVLGSADEVTPYAGGLDLARSWQVPKPNLFVYPRGHFTVYIALERDTEPQDRVAAILRDEA